MKRAVFIAICILGIINFSSCRSTSASCGLAENTTQTQQNHQQNTIVFITKTV